MERAWVAVDVHQLWTAAQYEFGDGNKIDFQTLLKDLKKTYAEVNLTLQAYLLDKAFHQDERFQIVLKRKGFTPNEVTSYVYRRQTSSPASVQIAIDAMESINNHDHYVLISGSGELIPLIQHLQKNNKTVDVWTFRKDAAGELLKTVTNIHFLDRNHLYARRPRGRSRV